jgi:sugar lactone lactonase YvrE
VNRNEESMAMRKTPTTDSRPSQRIRLLAVSLLSLLAALPAAAFTTFESGQVRPLELSPDGTRLFAVDTPDNRLEVFSVSGTGLTHVASVPVGLEPVAVAARTNGEVWVVNHLSDSVSIVDMTSSPPQVVRTLLVGDEPRDIVFAGPQSGGAFTRAFITTARRGQNVPASVPPLLTTEGTPRALVWVFDATNLGTSLEGTPLEILELFGDTPRALAATADGAIVYAAVLHSGNQTAAVTEGAVCNGGAGAAQCSPDGNTTSPNGLPGGNVPGGLPAPNTNSDLVAQNETGLIVKFDPGSGQWQDELGRNWSNGVRFHLPDVDVFAIDADAAMPAETGSFTGVGTVLFNMAVNPVSDVLYVSNTEARNEVRFEGPGIFAGQTVRGHLHEARITVIDGANVDPRHLNKHVTGLPQGYRTTPMPAGVAADSLATPLQMAITSDGTTLYVAAFGSGKVGVFDTGEIEDDTFVPDDADHVVLTGGGPSGLVLDEPRDRLYVLTRFDNSVKVVDTTTRTQIASHALYNPEPPAVESGRRFLYDASFTSSNGEASCSSCHIFGDFDSLGWDLGNPDDDVLSNPNPFGPIGFGQPFHPMKGPMTTQTLRGMRNHGPMHWRGDRTGAYAEANVEPDGGGFSEDLAFKEFNVAFDGLLGRDSGPLSAADMQAFTDFILEVMLPPNPIRSLDNSLTASQAAGRNFYMTQISDGETCNGCHEIDASQGFFGANGRTTFEAETQEFKVAHLRNAYQKVGMFGMPDVPFVSIVDRDFTGDQVRGFGFLHDGSIDTVFHFLRATVFSIAGGDATRRQIEDFSMAFDNDLAPIVGQQTTLTATNEAIVDARIDLLVQRASTDFTMKGFPGAQECDLIVKGNIQGQQRGWVLLFSGSGIPFFQSDSSNDGLPTPGALRELVDDPGNGPLTYTCMPPGSGVRAGIDRDEDGFLDRDELDAGSDPADPASIPGGGAAPIDTRKIVIRNKLPDDASKNRVIFLSKDPAIVPASRDSAGDPRCGADPAGTVKATLEVRSDTSGESHQTDLPCQNWQALGSAGSPKGYRYRDGALTAGTAKIVLWKPGLLKATLLGRGASTLDYDLQVGVSQGSVAVVFATSTTDVCAVCGPFNGRDGSDGKGFLAKVCAAPASCAP